MADIEQYGNLSDKELLEFINEIDDEDEDIQIAQDNAAKKIEIEEEQSLLSEIPDNNEIEAYYGNDAWRKINGEVCIFGSNTQRKANEASIKANKQRAQKLKQDRIQIQRMAFSQNDIKLSDSVESENFKLLISFLTQEHARMVDKYTAFINRRLTLLLNPLIPLRLRTCKMLYPNSIRACPGFIYNASKEYGQGKTFWATPDIPYFFEQNTEQDILIKQKSNFLISIDKAVVNYHLHKSKKINKEIKYASTLIRNGVHTYFELLKLNPFWFEILYNSITKNEQ